MMMRGGSRARKTLGAEPGDGCFWLWEQADVVTAIAHPEFEEVGSQPTDDLETILAAWAAIHSRLMDYVAGISAQDLRRETRDVDFGQGTVGGVLQGLAQHDLDHIRQAEAGLKQAQVVQPED